MKLSEELKWRGFVAEHTLGAVEDLDKGSRKFYLGVDPSAPSMTIGNLAALMMCKVFMRHGYEATMLVGGATGQIGDPKMDKERPLKPVEEIERNAKNISSQFERIMGKDIRIVNNNDWLSGLGFYQFLNEVGQYFSMTQLLDRDFVKARTGEGGSGLSVAEFSYSLMQGYDFLHLFKTDGIDLQLCGVDQIGNCMSGLHLIDKKEHAKADIWSMPLIIDKVTGRKFGKSEGNAVWLAEGKTSVFDFYQFWLNQADESVEDYLKFYTLIMPDELTALMAEHSEKPGERLAQKRLAMGVTGIVHGGEKAEKVARVTEILFGGSTRLAHFEFFSAVRTHRILNTARLQSSKESSDCTQTRKTCPGDMDFELLAEFLATAEVGSLVSDALVSGGLAESKGEARRLIESGAVSVGGRKVVADETIGERAIVKKGKNKFMVVK